MFSAIACDEHNDTDDDCSTRQRDANMAIRLEVLGLRPICKSKNVDHFFDGFFDVLRPTGSQFVSWTFQISLGPRKSCLVLVEIIFHWKRVVLSHRARSRFFGCWNCSEAETVASSQRSPIVSVNGKRYSILDLSSKTKIRLHFAISLVFSCSACSTFSLMSLILDSLVYSFQFWSFFSLSPKQTHLAPQFDELTETFRQCFCLQKKMHACHLTWQSLKRYSHPIFLPFFHKNYLFLTIFNLIWLYSAQGSNCLAKILKIIFTKCFILLFVCGELESYEAHVKHSNNRTQSETANSIFNQIESHFDLVFLYSR